MRLFYAVAAGEPEKAAAAGTIARLRAVPGDYRWVDPRDMHVTLRFLGETPERELPGVLGRMRRAAEATAPFAIEYGTVGGFDSDEDPRVVWVGLTAGAGEMEALAGRLGRDEPRPYAPHLTLGRRRRERTPPGFLAALRAEKAWGLRREVRRISLYASRPAPFGHVYEVVSEEELRGR